VVDDVAENRDVLCRRLERPGIRSRRRARPPRARAARRTTFDLVLLDVMMPELDGYGVLERSRGTGAARHPVIMISASTSCPASCAASSGARGLSAQAVRPGPAPGTVNVSLEKKRLRDQEVDYLRESGA